jgi:hypothetical protein
LRPAGSGAGHDPPNTPLALVKVSVEAVAVPAIVAVPVHMVPSAARPENLNCPSNDDPRTAPLTCPDQLTEVDVQLPVTSDPDCASTIVTCMVSLLDDAMVPFQVPAMFVVVPAETAYGAVELAPQTEALTARQTMSASRIVPPRSVRWGERERAVAFNCVARRTVLASPVPERADPPRLRRDRSLSGANSLPRAV